MSVQFWDAYAAAGYDALQALLPYQALQQDMLQAAALVPGDRVLVAGCGTGNFEARALRLQPEVSIDAVDFSPRMLERARTKCRGSAAVRHHQADLCGTLPFADGVFSVAVMSNVLYALPDPMAALREIARVVQPGGRFILSDRYPHATEKGIVAAHFGGIRRLPLGARCAAFGRTLLAMPALLGVIIATIGIARRHRVGTFSLYSFDEISARLAEVGFTREHSTSVYAEQCWLVQARREACLSQPYARVSLSKEATPDLP